MIYFRGSTTWIVDGVPGIYVCTCQRHFDTMSLSRILARVTRIVDSIVIERVE